MNQNNRIFVIARYEENLDWIYDLKGNIIIYNKDRMRKTIAFAIAFALAICGTTLAAQ